MTQWVFAVLTLLLLYTVTPCHCGVLMDKYVSFKPGSHRANCSYSLDTSSDRAVKCEIAYIQITPESADSTVGFLHIICGLPGVRLEYNGVLYTVQYVVDKGAMYSSIGTLLAHLGGHSISNTEMIST